MKELSELESKLRMIELLKAFHIYCKENEIEWFLAYGSLLGAVRENGFIKWDNDIDVFIPYKSAQKLMRSFPSNARYGLKWSYFENGNSLLDRIYFFEKGTFTIGTDSSYEEGGISLDGFILYDLPSGKTATLIRTLLLRLAQVKRIQRAHTSEWKWYKRVFILLLKILTITISSQNIEKWYYKLLLMNKPKKDYYALTETTYWGADVFPKKWFKTTTVSFEGGEFPAPREYDLVLRRIYGNYLVPPPVEERKKQMNPVFIS